MWVSSVEDVSRIIDDNNKIGISGFARVLQFIFIKSRPLQPETYILELNLQFALISLEVIMTLL